MKQRNCFATTLPFYAFFLLMVHKTIALAEDVGGWRVIFIASVVSLSLQENKKSLWLFIFVSGNCILFIIN